MIMTEMLVPNNGAKGIDITRPDGSVQKLDADKSGRVSVTDPKLVSQLKAEGFTVTGVQATFNVDGFPCSCGHQSLFRVCGKCGTDNGNSDQSDNASI
jgi:hypothetical protein